MYHIKRVTVLSTNTIAFGNIDIAVTGTKDQQNAGGITISTIGDGWVAREAWKRGFRTWKTMQDEAMHATSSSIKGTWSDFKVLLSEDMEGGTVLQPMDNGGNLYSGGEWDYSTYVSPDGTTGADEFGIWMLGTHEGSIGNYSNVALIKSYAESRATMQEGPSVPSPVSDDPLTNVFDYGTTVDEVLDNVESRNDSAPYDLFNYPGENNNGPKPAVVVQAAIPDGSAVLSGFTAMCGLVEIETKSPIASDVYSVLVELAPGDYRGIKADVI
jgi:hypothetical protein